MVHVCFCSKPCDMRKWSRFVSDGGNSWRCFPLFEWPSLASSPSFPPSLISFRLSVFNKHFLLLVSVCRECVWMYWFPPQLCPCDTVWLACWHHRLIDDDSSVNITDSGARKGHREFTHSHLWLNSYYSLVCYRGKIAW